MSAIHIVFHTGPATYTAEEKISGGQFVAPGEKGGVKVAAADAEKVLGVAVVDAQPASAAEPGVLTAKPDKTSVAYGPATVMLETEGKLAFGDNVGVGANGKAKKHSAGAVVGKVVDSPAGNKALIRLA